MLRFWSNSLRYIWKCNHFEGQRNKHIYFHIKTIEIPMEIQIICKSMHLKCLCSFGSIDMLVSSVGELRNN